MFDIQILKTTAPIQLSKPKIKTITTQQAKVVQKKPAKQNFKSIFTLGGGNSKIVQLMMEDQHKVAPTDSPLRKDQLSAVADMKM